ncbi:hypothetical protein M9H77_37009 [Catharanthus roseus]|uniref:Uncharacterized protein n=1 Tax=Catharanthus roseus TaxID=4058 RepID=A0ACB9ZTF8_CATRO|nr:hypothetical protein M9H77_37009 [Catharanthus roseus]
MGVRLFVIERSYVVWLVFDYEMPELISDGLVLGIRTLSVEPHCCITCSFKIGHRAALMCLDSLRLPSCARNPHVGSSIGFVKICREARRCPTQPQLTYIRFDTRFETLDFRQTIRVNCLNFKVNHMIYWLEIIPEREPIPVIDLSDDESIEGPEMAPVVAPGIGPGTSIEEDPSEPTLDSEMIPEPEQGTPAVTGSMGTSVANTMPAAASPTPIPPVASVSSFPASLLWGGVREYDICGYCLWREQRARRQESARAAMLEEELAQTRAAHAAREREILELINERDWLRQFIAQFLGTTRDSVDRARDELESRPGGSGSHIGTFWFLETCQVHNLPTVRTRLCQKILKIDSLNLRERPLLIQNKLHTKVELQRALAPLPPMGFAAAVEAATQTEMADQAVIQRKTAIGSATAPYKRPGQGP